MGYQYSREELDHHSLGYQMHRNNLHQRREGNLGPTQENKGKWPIIMKIGITTDSWSKGSDMFTRRSGQCNRYSISIRIINCILRVAFIWFKCICGTFLVAPYDAMNLSTSCSIGTKYSSPCYLMEIDTCMDMPLTSIFFHWPGHPSLGVRPLC